MSDFKAGDRVLWDTGSCWKRVPATVLGLSKTGKRVSIKTDPLPQLSGRQYWARVTPAKLSPLKTVLEFEGERHTLST